MLIHEQIATILLKRPLHVTLLDPAKQEPGKIVKIAEAADRLGTDAFFIGGSENINQVNLSLAVNAVKKTTKKPMIFFPSHSGAYSLEFHAMLFLSLFNSNNVKYVIRTQAESALLVKMVGIEVLPTAYLVIAPGMQAGVVGEAELIGRDDIGTAVGYAAAAEILGLRYLYLECGSGSPEIVPPAMIREIKSTIRLPLIAGGGITNAEAAQQLLEAGADILVTGTIAENEDYKQLAEIITVVKRFCAD